MGRGRGDIVDVGVSMDVLGGEKAWRRIDGRLGVDSTSCCL